MSSKPELVQVRSSVKVKICQILEKHNQAENANFVEVEKFDIEASTDFNESTISIFMLTADCRKSSNEAEADNGNRVLLTWMLKTAREDFLDEEALQAFHKERVLYNIVLSKFPVLTADGGWHPKCLTVYRDMIVLQNVYSMGYNINCVGMLRLNNQQMLSVLKSLAQMHACSLFAEHVDPSLYKELTGTLKETLFTNDSFWFCLGLIVLKELARIDPKYSKAEKAVINSGMFTYMMEACQMLKASQTYRNVLCYRPGPTTNIMLRSSCGDGNEKPVVNAMLVDFYQCIYAPPVVDLLCVMALYLDRKEQKHKEYDYLDYYYDELVENLKLMSSQHEQEVGFSKSELLESYHVYHMFGLIYRAFNMTITHVPKEIHDFNYIYLDRLPSVLAYMEANNEFKASMLKCVEDIADKMLENFSV